MFRHKYDVMIREWKKREEKIKNHIIVKREETCGDG